MVYKGDDDDEGLTVYMNGTRRDSSTAWSNGGNADDSGEVMIGKLFNNYHWNNAKCEVDELLIWNTELNDDDIRKIYDSYISTVTTSNTGAN